MRDLLQVTELVSGCASEQGATSALRVRVHILLVPLRSEGRVPAQTHFRLRQKHIRELLRATVMGLVGSGSALLFIRLPGDIRGASPCEEIVGSKRSACRLEAPRLLRSCLPWDGEAGSTGEAVRASWLGLSKKNVDQPLSFLRIGTRLQFSIFM